MRDIGATYDIHETANMNYKSMKQSYNVLNGYLVAAGMADNYVFMIEDDIFPGHDFFRCHYNLQELERGLFCSIATRNQNTRHYSGNIAQSDNQFTYKVTSQPVYQSLGVCFNKEVVKQLIAPHAQSAQYYKNPRPYCLTHFKSSIGADFVEQDGLIRRIHERTKMPIAYPDYPRAYHAGLYGYHRLIEDVRMRSLDKRISWIMDTCFDARKMKPYDQHNDSQPCDLSVNCELLSRSN
jgi:hypothetical protein